MDTEIRRGRKSLIVVNLEMEMDRSLVKLPTAAFIY